MALARMTWRFASSAPPPPPDPEEPPAPLPGDIDELVFPANRYWLDSGTAGQVLSPALGYSVGVTHEVTLYTQPGDWTPPADAVVLSGGNFVRGPGWANMRAGSYRMRIIKPGGSVTETDVRIATDAAATHTCTTEQQLTDAIAAVNADIASLGAAFPGAIIELSAANEWAPRTITINAGVGRTRRVYFPVLSRFGVFVVQRRCDACECWAAGEFQRGGAGLCCGGDCAACDAGKPVARGGGRFDAQLQCGAGWTDFEHLCAAQLHVGHGAGD